MPELPEVEVLVRHLDPLLRGKTIRSVSVFRAKTIAPFSPRQISRTLTGARFEGVTRRGKYLVFSLKRAVSKQPLVVLGHLGMTGRMYLVPAHAKIPKNAPVVLRFNREQLIFEDTRYFGRFTLDRAPLANLGPEPLAESFTAEHLHTALKGSRQPIKVRLLDQSVLAGVGNIYASEALFRAGISPCARASSLDARAVTRLWSAVREVLSEAIALGSTVPLNFGGERSRDKLFYYGRTPGTPDFYEERLNVYGREDMPCRRCGSQIRRAILGGRSTFFCARCQPAKTPRRRSESV